jgi:hypothetical protein
VVTPEDFEFKGRDIEKYIAAVGGYPAMPSDNSNSEYWKDLEVITQAQIDRRNGLLPPPSIFTLPDLWKDFTAYDVAEAVHDEVNQRNDWINALEPLRIVHSLLTPIVPFSNPCL